MLQLERPKPLYTQDWFLSLAVVLAFVCGIAFMRATEVTARYHNTSSEPDTETAMTVDSYPALVATD